ncbi:MAG: MoxR family ATPase [Nitrospirae bacterium]|nr:MoxR family ATPase [Nitrospirota bacterium]
MPEIKNEAVAGILRELSKYLQGKESALKLSLISFFSRGHLLIEDMPGLGKTTLAIGIARALGLTFGRIQCTSDLLPTDITGLSVFNKSKGEFEFRKGPIFSNIVLVDEINRATPKTQSALLEAMGEKQVTIEETTFKLARPFFVVATQNPVEHYGTFPLPESQLDRFMMKIGIGYPHRTAEMDIIRGGSRREELYSLEPFLTSEECVNIQDSIRKNVYISEKILDYSLNIIEATRTSKYLTAGVSTRGALALANTARAHAFFNSRDYVIPEDIKALAEFTIPHRVLFKEELDTDSKREIIRSLLEKIPTPL